MKKEIATKDQLFIQQQAQTYRDQNKSLYGANRSKPITTEISELKSSLRASGEQVEKLQERNGELAEALKKWNELPGWIKWVGTKISKLTIKK